MILEDTSGPSKQKACDDDRQQASRCRAHDNPSIKLEADNKNKHHDNGDPALSKDTEGQPAEKQTDDKRHDDDGEPRRRRGTKPSQPSSQSGYNCINDCGVSRLGDALVRVIVKGTRAFFWVFHGVWLTSNDNKISDACRE